MAIFETEFTGVAFGDGLEQGAAGHEAGRQNDGADECADPAGGAAGEDHRGVNELDEWANAGGDYRDYDDELALDAELILNHAVHKHDDQGGQRVDGVDGADFSIGQSNA